jgi:hypothetical protein
LSDAVAGLATIRCGPSRYAHSLRDQEGTDQKFATQHRIVDTTAKVAGGIAALMPAMAPAAFGLTAGLPGMMVRGGASNALLGGADAATRGGDPLSAAGWGGLIGGGVPLAGAVVRGLASPIVSNIAARVDPEDFARRQVARAIIESGRPTAACKGSATSWRDQILATSLEFSASVATYRTLRRTRRRAGTAIGRG